ncbi:hypothetical protein RugamoR64_49710 [Duganella rhizosphaerae]|uniref:Hsp20/alpha crystallin family protein n=1 Tax=Duganella rhizosphaerae TaxID=2885763 RepID=UPI0030E88574
MNPALPDGSARRALTRLHPLRGLGEAWQRLRFRHAVRQLNQQIRVQLSEDPKAYTVLALLPGAGKGDIEVAVEGDRVRIRAKGKADHVQHEGRSLLRHERYAGHRYRMLRLPQEVDAGQASAEFRHGVLKLVLPKAGRPRGLVPVS